MNAVLHQVTHVYQPTSTTCGYAALSILLSHYSASLISPSEIATQVPEVIDENGKPAGSITAQLASWCAEQNYVVDFYSFDFQITDFSWSNCSTNELLEKLKLVKGIRTISSLGNLAISQAYVQAYIDLLQNGGNLHIQQFASSKLLYELLTKGPIFVNIVSAVINGHGRQNYPEPETSKLLEIPDDINGTVGTHSVVIYGNDDQGNFSVADPWEGLVTIDPETMVAAIAAANIFCDSQCFQINTK